MKNPVHREGWVSHGVILGVRTTKGHAKPNPGHPARLIHNAPNRGFGSDGFAFPTETRAGVTCPVFLLETVPHLSNNPYFTLKRLQDPKSKSMRTEPEKNRLESPWARSKIKTGHINSSKSGQTPILHPRDHPQVHDPTEKKTPDETERSRRDFQRITGVFCSAPAVKPTNPPLSICHGVQGPCPRKMLETKAAPAPTTNPLSAPKTTAVTIITKVVG